jgi:nitrate reductase gamma subunit
MVIKDYLILSCRAGFVFAIHSALAAFIYLCVWLLEKFVHLFSSSEPMLWDYVPLRYIFEGGEALMIGAVVIHGLKDVWTALESGQSASARI